MMLYGELWRVDLISVIATREKRIKVMPRKKEICTMTSKINVTPKLSDVRNTAVNRSAL